MASTSEELKLKQPVATASVPEGKIDGAIAPVLEGKVDATAAPIFEGKVKDAKRLSVGICIWNRNSH